MNDKLPSDRLIAIVGVAGLCILHIVLFESGYLLHIGVFIIGLVLYRFLFLVLLVWWFVAWWSSRKESVRHAHGVYLALLLIGLTYTLIISPDMPVMHGLLARMKSQINPNELQTWAVEALRTHERGPLSESELPPFLRRVNYSYLKPHVSVGTYLSDQPAVQITVVGMSFGAGFMGWGLMVGNTNLVLHPSVAYYMRWKPGVYAFADNGS